MTREEGSESKNIVGLMSKKGSHQPRNVDNLKKVEKVRKQISPGASRRGAGSANSWVLAQ